MKKLSKAEFGQFKALVASGDERAIETEENLQKAIRAILSENNDITDVEIIVNLMVEEIRSVLRASLG